MSRIRSIHPGLWTDEAFMSLSAFARLLYIGLWNEAFDDGVFEWKPLTIKAKIFPVDAVDVKALLAEIVAAGSIREGAGTGKQYGLIRNFRLYQRPKKPNSSGLLQPQDHEYVGLVPNQSGTGDELRPQMEDEGGEKDEGVAKPTASSARATRWPKGQKVPDDWKTWAKASFPSVEAYRLTTETRQFEDYWPGKDGKAGLRTDWEAEYHMWMRRKFGADEVVDSGIEPDLCVIGPEDDDFKLVEAVRGKPLVLGKSGKTTVSRAEIDRAREVSGLGVH
jgi:hypothetical protein